MRIVIKYDSCWQTGFLDGDSNSAVCKKNNPRHFIATSSTRGEKSTPISHTTVLGVLCRLIGDQRKLFQARESSDFYFSDLENKISVSFSDVQNINEKTYLTNKSDDRCAQGAWLGVISDDNPWFHAKSASLWSVLFLDRKEIVEFVLSQKRHDQSEFDQVESGPKELLKRLDQICNTKGGAGLPWKTLDRKILEIKDKIKKIEQKKEDCVTAFQKQTSASEKQQIAFDKRVDSFAIEISELSQELERLAHDPKEKAINQSIICCVSILTQEFPNCEFLVDGVLFPQRVYVSALYLQAKHLLKDGFDLPYLIETKGKNKGEIVIKGFSRDSKANRGFNGPRDWLNSMAGGRKKAVGTPCEIQKQSGTLEIEIKTDINRAIELKTMIDNAGVSAFYLGKKGLAYVSHIDVR